MTRVTPIPGTTAAKLIALAESQVGYHEGRDAHGNWNNDQKYSTQVPTLAWSNYQAWCCTFLMWLAWKIGGSPAANAIATIFGPGKLIPFAPTAGTMIAKAGYQKAGRWSEYPAPGAQGFLADASGTTYHTFLVRAYDETNVYTVEGNTNDSGSPQGDGVYAHTRSRDSVYGYGYPNYPEGIQSADPAYAHQNPKPPATPTKETPMALKRNHVELGNFRLQQALDQYTAAVDNGRHALVKKTRDSLRKIRNEAPKK